jgi:pyruvate/2-oxoglutarate/acetoin dehydrogenase E1 component
MNFSGFTASDGTGCKNAEPDMRYREALTEAMRLCADQPNAVFLGQAVRFDGTGMFGTLKDVPMSMRIEMPVAEELQMGISTGLALAGALPISIFPRINFLFRAADQLVNHLDKLPAMSDGGWCPKVIIRTAVGTRTPLNPGYQHLGNYCREINAMLSYVHVAELTHTEQIIPAYEEALKYKWPTILVEHHGAYGT